MGNPSLPVSILQFPRRPTAAKKNVTGLWENDNSALRNLADRHVQHIFSFLEPLDLFRCEMVAPRWNSIATREALWETADFTNFVAYTYQQFVSEPKKRICFPNPQRVDPTERTTQFVVDKIKQYSSSIQSLTIHSIHHKLSADFFLLPTPKIQKLFLSNFTNLTDTHVRALLFLAASTTQQRRCVSMRTIQLLDCPHVTQACLGSISHFCPRLLTAYVSNNKHNNQQQSTPSSPTSVASRPFVGSGTKSLAELFLPLAQ